MKLSHNIGDVQRAFRGLTRSQVPFATAMALNDTAADVKLANEEAMPVNLDRPRPFTQKGIYVVRASKGANPQARVGIKRVQAAYLVYQIEGGVRGPKRKAVPVPVGIARDSYGNMKRGAIAKLLAGKDAFVASAGDARTAHLPPGVYRRMGKGGGQGRVQMLVAFEGSATYQAKRYDFPGISLKRADAVARGHFERRLLAAIRTAR